MPTRDNPAGAELAASLAVLWKRDVCKALKVSPWQLNRWIKQGYFKPPIYLTPTSNRGCWTVRYIADFLEQRARARRVKSLRGMFRQRHHRVRGGGDAR